jgi:type IX secretion system PorP/SprF family membrane protein
MNRATMANNLMNAMKLNRYAWVLAAGLLGALMPTSDLYAQDPILSQYYTNRMYLNPAMTGFEPGATVSLNHRNQWHRIAGQSAKFVTNSVTADINAPCLQSAVGLYYLDNTEGEGFLKWQHVGASYAWYSRRGRSSRNSDFQVRLGMKATYNWRSLDWSRLRFSDQLDAIYGVVGPTSLPIPDGERSFNSYADFGSGVTLSWRHRGDNRLTVGGAIHHLVRIDNSLAFLDDTLPVRSTIHATYVHSQDFGGGTYFLVPMLKVDLQKAAVGNYFGEGFMYRSIMYGVAFSFQQNPGLWGGVWLHSRNGVPNQDDINSIILAIGTEVGNGHQGKFASASQTYRIGLSYDYNISGIRSDGGGTVEVSLTMNFGNAQLLRCEPRAKGSLPCPKF